MKKIALLFMVLALLLALVPTVFADGSVTIEGGVLSVVGRSFNFGTVDLDFGNTLDKTVSFTNPFAPAWRVADPTGTGAGWHVTIVATNFECTSALTPCAGPDTAVGGGDDHSIPLTPTDKHAGESSFFMRLLNTDIVWVDGQFGIDGGALGDDMEGDLMPTATGFTGALVNALSGSGQTFMTSAANEGMGTYDFHPDFRLFVPAETYAGSYTSALTVAVIASP